MLRKLIAICLVLFGVITTGTTSPIKTDVGMLKEIESAYRNGYFSAALALSVKAVEEYPSSSFFSQFQLYSGKSYFMIGRLREAEIALDRLTLKLVDNEICAETFYWLGRIKYLDKNYQKASICFYNTINILKKLFKSPNFVTVSNVKMMRNTLLYAAYTLTALGENKQAENLLENAFVSYKMEEDLQSATGLLFTLYKKSNSWEKICSLYRQLSGATDSFPRNLSDSIRITTGEAYSNIKGKNKEAWAMYLSVLEDGSKEAALYALTKAYRLTETDSSLKAEELLNAAGKKLSEYPGYLAELWLRLGIDAWNAGEKKKSLDYLDRSDETMIRKYKELSLLYRAENDFINGDYLNAYNLLLTNSDKSSIYYPDYLVNMARYSMYMGLMEQAQRYAEEVLSIQPNNIAVDIIAFTYAENGRWTDALKILQEHNQIDTVLYAEALLEADGSTTAINTALEILTKYDVSDNLINGYLRAGLYNKIQETIVEKNNLDDEVKKPTIYALYIEGLSLFAQGEWEKARKIFSNRELILEYPYAGYYKAYSLYRQGETSLAYTAFTEFIRDFPGHKMARNAEMFAARSALQMGKDILAVEYSKKAIEASYSEKDKREAIILYASICSDTNRLDEAIEYLKPYAEALSVNSIPVRYKLSEVYAQKGAIKEADNELKEIITNYPDSPLVEESVYKRGELFYTAGDYSNAATCFAEYRRLYPNGLYIAPALYYNGRTLEETNSIDYAVILYEKLINEQPDSSFEFAALNKIAFLYRSKGEYENSLNAIEKMLIKYPEDSHAAEVLKLRDEVNLLNSGSGEKTVQLLSEYETFGRSTSVKGRKVGLDLAIQYLGMQSKRAEGADILLEITGTILASDEKKFNNESEVVGEAFRLLALYYRSEGILEKASNNYLLAAEYFGGLNKEKAAQSLYGATEAMDAAGRVKEAIEIYKTMKTSFVNSEWTKKAATFFSERIGENEKE